MFELMGYSHDGIGVLGLSGPIDPDKVSNVSRDAIVAFVECKVSTYWYVEYMLLIDYFCHIY